MADIMAFFEIIGALIGILAALAGFYVALRAFGYFEYLGGSNLPKGTAPVLKSDLIKRLKTLNNSANPFKLVSSDKSDFEVDWTIVDEKWLFGTSWLNKKYHAWLYVDEKRKAVRYCEMITEKEAGFTNAGFSFQTTFFRGVVLFQKERSALWSIDDSGRIGKIYDYKFDPMDVKGVVKRISNEAGWEFVQVVTPDHASREA